MRAGDMQRAGALIAAAGQLLQARAGHAHQRTHDWAHGPAAHAYDTQPGHTTYTAADPASAPVLAGYTAADLDPHHELAELVNRTADVAALLLETLRRIGAPAPDRWCWFHWAWARTRQPTPKRRHVRHDGAARLACETCYRASLRLGRPPRPDEVRALAQGRRLRSPAA